MTPDLRPGCPGPAKLTHEITHHPGLCSPNHHAHLPKATAVTPLISSYKTSSLQRDLLKYKEDTRFEKFLGSPSFSEPLFPGLPQRPPFLMAFGPPHFDPGPLATGLGAETCFCLKLPGFPAAALVYHEAELRCHLLREGSIFSTGREDIFYTHLLNK